MQLRLFDDASLDSSRDAWRTPKWLFDKYNAEFGFKIDAAASPDNALCQHYFSVGGVDALETDWVNYAHVMDIDPIFWLNPPFSYPLIEHFMRKAHEAWQNGGTVCCVLCPSTCSKWWNRYVWGTAELRCFEGRVPFVPPPGVIASTNDRDSVVAIFHAGEIWGQQKSPR